MDDKHILLIYKKLKSGLSVEEEEVLRSWLEESEAHRKVEQEITKSWNALSQFEPTFEVNAEEDFETLIRPKLSNISTENHATVRPLKVSSRRKWMNIAAIGLLLIGFASTLFFFQQSSVAMQIAKTDAGETKAIVLSDGSKVWLNENSLLEYPASFQKNVREIKLSGEAYFDVERNPKSVFRIETSETIVKVLGTSFNVKARDENSETSVFVNSGKVAFISKENSQETILEKNQAATFNENTKKMTRTETASVNAIYWKTDELEFRNQPLKDVFAELSNVFNVSIELENSALENCPFSMAKQKADLAKILKNISQIFQTTTTVISPNQYLIKGGSC